MPTLNQLANKNKGRKKKKHKDQTKALGGSPLRRGVALRAFTTSPKKPNSAQRKVAKVKLYTGRKSLQEFLVLVIMYAQIHLL
jgi:small subunit ribosomal protein S12